MLAPDVLKLPQYEYFTKAVKWDFMVYQFPAHRSRMGVIDVRHCIALSFYPIRPLVYLMSEITPA